MAKPIILTVDDDPEVLRAIERDLRKRYSEHYRVIRAESGASALEICAPCKSAAIPWPCSWSISVCRK